MDLMNKYLEQCRQTGYERGRAEVLRMYLIRALEAIPMESAPELEMEITEVLQNSQDLERKP